MTKCSAAQKWNLIDDKMVTTETCQNDATCLLTNKGHWKDIPYCEECAKWMAMASNRFGLPLEIKQINQRRGR